MTTSTDGGLTWSEAATNGQSIIGGQPLVRPGGTVIVPANANESAVDAFNSTNGGFVVYDYDHHHDQPSHGRWQSPLRSPAHRWD